MEKEKIYKFKGKYKEILNNISKCEKDLIEAKKRLNEFKLDIIEPIKNGDNFIFLEEEFKFICAVGDYYQGDTEYVKCMNKDGEIILIEDSILKSYCPNKLIIQADQMYLLEHKYKLN